MNQLLHPHQQQSQQPQQSSLPPPPSTIESMEGSSPSLQEKAPLPPASSMQPPSEESFRAFGKMMPQQPQQFGGKEASRREPQLETRSFAFPPQPLSQQQQPLFGRRDSDVSYNSTYGAQPTTDATAQQQTPHLPSIPSSLFPAAPSSRSSAQFQPASPATLQQAQPSSSVSPSLQPKQAAPSAITHPHLTLEQTSNGEQLVNAEDINSIKRAINAGDWSYVDQYINSLMQVYSPSLCEYHQKHSSSVRTHQQYISHSLLQLLLKIHQQRYLEALDRNDIPTSVQLLNLMHQFIPLYPEVANKLYTDCYNFFHDRFKFMKFKAESLHVNNMVQYRTVLANEIMSVIVGIPKSMSPTPPTSSSSSDQQQPRKTEQQPASLLSSSQPAFSAMSAVQAKPQVGVVHRYHYENKGGVSHVTQDWQPAPLLSTTPLGTMATSFSPLSAAETASTPDMARRASITAAPVTLIQHPAYHQAATMSQNPQAQSSQPASSASSTHQQRPGSPHLYSYIHSYEFPPRKGASELNAEAEMQLSEESNVEKTPQRTIEPLKLSQKKQKQTFAPVHTIIPTKTEDLPLKKRKRKGKDTGENKAKKQRITVPPVTEQLASGEPSPGTQSKANLNLLVQAFNMLSDDETSHSSDGKSSDGEESIIEQKIRPVGPLAEEEDEASVSSTDSTALKRPTDDTLYYSASASSSAASSSNSSTVTPPSTPEVLHASILRAAEAMNPPQKLKKKRRNIITDDLTQSEEDDERHHQPAVDFTSAVAQNTSASAHAAPAAAPVAATVAATPAKKTKAKQKKKKSQTPQKKKKAPKVHDDTEILLDTLATTAAATTVDVSELVAQKVATPAQSLMNAKTIKPVRKLCTGGITSTPAIRDRMIKVFEQNKGPVTWEFIQSKVSGNRAKVWATLCMFVNEGLVLQVGKGRRGHPFRYYVLPGVTTEQFQSLEEKFKSMDKESIQIHKQYKAQQKAEQDKKKQEASKPAEPSVTNSNTIPSISSMLGGKPASAASDASLPPNHNSDS